MPRTRTFQIAGEHIAPGTTREGRLKFSESYLGVSVNVPVWVMRARRAGPRVLLTGAIHGDEVNGMGIVRELLYDQPPALKRGALICIPVVNIYGLDNHRRYMPDRRDLNRSFPGNEKGSPTSRLAHAIYHQVVLQCDYCIDFHSAAVRRTNYPNVRADLRKPEVQRIADAFGAELIVGSRGPRGSLRRTAVDAGIPTIILEAGEVWKIEPSVVEIGVRGALNVLKELGMIDGEVEKPSFQVHVSQTTWVRAESGGLLAFHARPGELVEEGEVLCTTYSIFGAERSLVHSPATGIVLGMTTMPAVKPGEPIYHIAMLSKRNYRAVQRRLRARGDSRYRRVQQDLATSITVTKKNEGSTT